MMAAAAGSPAKEELTVPPAAQPRRGASAGPTPTLLHDSALHSATNITAASTALITPESLAASLHSSVSSPTGTKLAVTTSSESPAGGEGARITLDEEKKIALSQLQELEVAIKVRRVTKVDGRKIRWIEYRARKQAEEEKQPANAKKRPRRSRSKTKGVENSENEANVNNNNNNNNNNKTDSTMKGDSTSSPLSVVGTSNVLESMKQQFLQGTENVDEPSVNGKSSVLAESSVSSQKRKSGRTRKSAGAPEGGSPSSTSPKKLSPSEASSPKGACLRSCGGSKGSSSSANGSVSEVPLTLSSTPTTPFTSDQPLAIGIKKNFFTPRSLTKGLREVRKMENGTDGASAVKAEEVKTPLTSPSASLHLTTALSPVVPDGAANEAKSSADSKPQPADSKVTKTTCPLIKAAAKLMAQPTSRSKSADSSSAKGKRGNSQKGSGRKASAKSVPRPESEPRTAVNGHNQMVQNGSSEEGSHLKSPESYSVGESCSGKASKQGNSEGTPGTASDSDSGLKRTRGRPRRRAIVLKKEGSAAVSSGKSGKKLATLVVDVHNTMNGEPQMVIPVKRPVLRGKRTSLGKNSSQNAEKSPDIKHSPVPASKRQKNEAKSKLDGETPQTGINSGSPHVDTKKGKTSKKNLENSVAVKEEKDDTSASTVNQIQMPPEQTQSTKHTKGVQRTTSRELPSECESSTAMPSNLQANKKKKVKKPVLKVKTLPTKHKEIEKIIKKSKKATTGGVSKQNRAQPKKNTIRKYLTTQKGKAASKIISNAKKEGLAQVKPRNSSREGESQSEDSVTHKQEPTHNTEPVKEQQPLDPSPSSESVLKTETPEVDVQNSVPDLRLTEEDSNSKADLAPEVPCLPSSTVPAVGYVEESSDEVKPNFVPQCETETHPSTNENTPTVGILGIEKSYEKVSDLPKISFQDNDNINNNNAEEEGVVICDKEITVMKDLSVKKLSGADDPIKCITNEECSLEELASKTKRDTIIEDTSVAKVLDLERACVKDEEQQVLTTQGEDCPKEDCAVENSAQSEVEAGGLKSEENVCDKNESYVETVPDGDGSQIPTHTVAADSCKTESTSASKESVLSSSSHGETAEVPFVEAAPVPASDLSLPDSTASTIPLQEVSMEVVEEASVKKQVELQPDSEDKITQSCSFTEEVMDTTESVQAKETDPTESNITEVNKVEENQTVDSTEPGDSEVQAVEVQTDALQDHSNSAPVVNQKGSLKQVKRRDGSLIPKKIKKGPVQSHSTTHLEHGRDDVHREVNDVKITKAGEASQEVSAGKTSESRELLDTLPPSQKDTDDVVQEIIPEVQPTRLTSAPEVHSSSVTKTKDKVPRILKQLFQDEGVQNMLKSMSEDVGVAPETSPNSDSGTHKLRPKRITEPMLSSSPELDAMEAFLTSSRKKKRGTELDTLYIDEGVLNLLTSKEHPTRRAHQEDAASDISQASSSKSFKVSKTTKSGEGLSDSRKRKLSGASTASNTSSSSKSLQPPEPKKIRVENQEPVEDPYELDTAEEFKEKSVIVGYSPLETAISIAKKKGPTVVPLSVKQKNKAIRMQLKLQKQKQLKSAASEGSEDQDGSNIDLVQVPDTLTVAKDLLPEPSSLPASVEAREVSGKSVPPIKIKLASDSVTIKPVPRQSPPQQTPEVTIVAKPPPPPPPVRVPIKPAQVVDSTSPPLPRQLPLTQMRASPDKPRPHPDRHSPSSQFRRLEPYPGVVPPAPPAPGFPSLVRNHDVAAAAAAAAAASKSRQRVGGESVRQSQRASVRQSEASYHFRDIALRKFNNFTQIILSPSTTKMKNALNSRVLRELCEALNILKRDESVRIVLLTGTGSTFCQGVDLTALQHPNVETRKKNAENLVRGIKDFLKALVQFSKPIIAGVNGNAMGLGVTMLPLFDMVIANDKAEFCLPYAKLGQVPEGGATYTFPNLCGKLQSTQLFLGHKLTARRAQEMGLVSESIWPATYQQELIPKVALLATQSAQSMEATKALMNHHLVTKLELSLESECRLLLQQWTSPHFAHLCKRFLDSQYIHLQKPVSLPL